MAVTRRSTLQDVAARVSRALTDTGITAVLTGGAAVTLYAKNQYQSWDLDFVTAAPMKDLSAVMAGLGFTRGAGRHFEHPSCRFVVEFVAWPVTLGDEVDRMPGRRFRSFVSRVGKPATATTAKAGPDMDTRAPTRPARASGRASLTSRPSVTYIDDHNYGHHVIGGLS